MSTESTSEVYTKAAERLRDTLKWFLTSLAAVGAVLIAGLSLSNIGEATGARLLAVAVGLVVAIAAVISAAAVCASVLGEGVNLSVYNMPTDPDLTRDISQDTALVAAIGDGGVAGLGEQLTRAVNEQQEAFREHQNDPQNETKKAVYRAKDLEVARLNGIADTVVRMAAYRLMRQRFNAGARWVAGLSVVAGVGIFLFAWGANAPDEAVGQIPAVVETPTDVEVHLDQAGRDRLQDELGEACVADVIPAVVLEDRGGGEYRVAVASTDDCDAILVDLGPADGAVALPAE
ncbi:hypothetical protein [Jiangella asiatica]|uniref:Uncharacterized protein n=1 Tax=Jiangella asiatica TaxID=2530372 RepID=A0A4V2Z0J7_9ACTN|nr:hypothetical protein [Jiangella asiatica]TDE01178.1 hypothetical protein E1269_23735 [Jiangella asiatica]